VCQKQNRLSVLLTTGQCSVHAMQKKFNLPFREPYTRLQPERRQAFSSNKFHVKPNHNTIRLPRQKAPLGYDLAWVVRLLDILKKNHTEHIFGGPLR
jgi:hypothetical protein